MSNPQNKRGPRLSTEKKYELVNLLSSIHAHGRSPNVQVIADEFGVSAANVYAYMRRYEGEGLVTKSADELTQYSSATSFVIDPDLEANLSQAKQTADDLVLRKIYLLRARQSIVEAVEKDPTLKNSVIAKKLNISNSLVSYYRKQAKK